MRSTAIIIVNYRTPGLVVDCLHSLQADVRAEPEVERDAVELPFIEENAHVVVATGRRDCISGLVGYAGDDGTVDDGVFDNQQVASNLP